MFNNLRRAGKEKMARQFVESEQAEAFLQILTEAEDAMLSAIEEQHDALGIDEWGDRPTPEDRKQALRDCWLAMLADEFPAHWVEHYSGLDNAGEAAAFADMSAEEWESTKATWADRYRSNGMEGTDDDLAAATVATRFGVDLETFERVVVEWPEGRQGDHLQEIVAGGVEMAVDGAETTTEEMRDLLADGDHDCHEAPETAEG